MYKTSSKAAQERLDLCTRRELPQKRHDLMPAHQQLLAARYVERLGITSITLRVNRERRKVTITADNDFRAALRGKKGVYHRAWCRSEETAQAVIDEFGRSQWKASTGNGQFDLTADEAMAALNAAAAAIQVTLTPSAAVIDRAKTFLRTVDRTLDEMKARGDMKPLNRAYKAYRLSQTANQQPVMIYYEWLTGRLGPVIDVIAERTMHCG